MHDTFNFKFVELVLIASLTIGLKSFKRKENCRANIFPLVVTFHISYFYISFFMLSIK